METSGCLSLDEGRLDDSGHWKFCWDENSKLSKTLFLGEGLSREERRYLFSSLRHNVAATNQLLKKVGISESNPLGKPLRMIHGDIHSGMSAYVRWGRNHPNPMLVLLNMSPRTSANSNGYTINLASAGWQATQHPETLRSVIRPLRNMQEMPLLMTQSRGSPGSYTLNRSLEAFEAAIFEVPIHGL